MCTGTCLIGKGVGYWNMSIVEIVSLNTFGANSAIDTKLAPNGLTLQGRGLISRGLPSFYPRGWVAHKTAARKGSGSRGIPARGGRHRAAVAILTDGCGADHLAARKPIRKGSATYDADSQLPSPVSVLHSSTKTASALTVRTILRNRVAIPEGIKQREAGKPARCLVRRTVTVSGLR